MPDPFTHFVFVDFENVPGVDVSAGAGHPVHVTLLIGKHQKSFGLEMLRAAKSMGDRLELVEVGASGHNALDITLAYYLGRAVENAPKAEFAIVSKDKDFDPMIAHLQAKGIAIARHTGFASLPFLEPAKKTSTKPPFATHPPAVSPKAPKLPAPPKPKVAVDRLGLEFIEEVITVWRSLADNPLLGARNHPVKNIRWRYPERFPYRIIYELDEAARTVLVLAVRHAARRDLV